MAKRIVARVGEYEKDGQTKGEWVKIGVIIPSQNGEYALIDPAVNLAGVLQKQNMYAMEKRKAGDEKARPGRMLMCSVFDDDAQQGQGQHQAPSGGGGSFDDDIPF